MIRLYVPGVTALATAKLSVAAFMLVDELNVGVMPETPDSESVMAELKPPW